LVDSAKGKPNLISILSDVVAQPGL
jgi:hypothetical protein